MKTNQDAYIIYPNFVGNKNFYLFAVCDGHGLNGHHASGFVKQNLPSNNPINCFFEDIRIIENLEHHYKNRKVDDDVSLRSAISQAFLQTNKELVDSPIDVNFSGSTTVSVLILNDRIFSANVGDSRAILGKFKNNQWTAFALSIDHKPDDKREMQRILANGGRVEAFKGTRID